MVLSWSMSSSYNLIKGYRIFYKHTFTDIKTFDGQKPEYKLTGLQPYTRSIASKYSRRRGLNLKECGVCTYLYTYIFKFFSNISDLLNKNNMPT